MSGHGLKAVAIQFLALGARFLRSWGLLHILKTADCQLKTADCRLLMSGHGLKAVAIQFLGFGSQVFALMWKL